MDGDWDIRVAKLVLCWEMGPDQKRDVMEGCGLVRCVSLAEVLCGSAAKSGAAPLDPAPSLKLSCPRSHGL